MADSISSAARGSILFVGEFSESHVFYDIVIWKDEVVRVVG